MTDERWAATARLEEDAGCKKWLVNKLSNIPSVVLKLTSFPE